MDVYRYELAVAPSISWHEFFTFVQIHVWTNTQSQAPFRVYPAATSLQKWKIKFEKSRPDFKMQWTNEKQKKKRKSFLFLLVLTFIFLFLRVLWECVCNNIRIWAAIPWRNSDRVRLSSYSLLYFFGALTVRDLLVKKWRKPEYLSLTSKGKARN